MKKARWRFAIQDHLISASFASASLLEMRIISFCRRSSSRACSAFTWEGSISRSLSLLDADRASRVCSQSASWHCLSCRCSSVVCMSRLCSCFWIVLRDVLSAASSLMSNEVSGGSGSLSCRLVGPRPGPPAAARSSSPRASSTAAAAARRVAAWMSSEDGGGGTSTWGAGGGGHAGPCGRAAASRSSRRSLTALACEAASPCSRRSRRSLMPSCCRALPISSLSSPRRVSTRSMGGALCKSCLEDNCAVFLQVPWPGLGGESAPLSRSGHTVRLAALCWRV
mmetsp:Transcript_41293/g.119457  ORF Transcript_41293/g.119457 Transcript_41293/m.119457 type:complete len:282 (+) Transcript_41293:470-1315(+)